MHPEVSSPLVVVEDRFVPVETTEETFVVRGALEEAERAVRANALVRHLSIKPRKRGWGHDGYMITFRSLFDRAKFQLFFEEH